VVSDAASILAVAVAERDQAVRALADHLQGNRRGRTENPACGRCRSLRAHIDRTEHQVALLTPDSAGSEAMF